MRSRSQFRRIACWATHSQYKICPEEASKSDFRPTQRISAVTNVRIYSSLSGAEAPVSKVAAALISESLVLSSAFSRSRSAIILFKALVLFCTSAICPCNLAWSRWIALTVSAVARTSLWSLSSNLSCFWPIRSMMLVRSLVLLRRLSCNCNRCCSAVFVATATV